MTKIWVFAYTQYLEFVKHQLAETKVQGYFYPPRGNFFIRTITNWRHRYTTILSSYEQKLINLAEETGKYQMYSPDFKSICISPDQSIRVAMKQIDLGRCGIALLVDSDYRLIGTVTDGDVRRALLDAINLDAPISVLLKRKAGTQYPNPITAKKGTSPDEIQALMQQHSIRQIPLLDNAGRLVDIAVLDDLLPENVNHFQAVLLAGGEQTRLHPLSPDLPRPMLPIGNRPLLEYTINQLRQAGIHEVNITTHYKADKVVDYFGDGSEFGVHINYLHSSDPSNTADGLRFLKNSDAPLLVINGDVLTRVDYRAMLAYHQEQHADMTVAVRMHDFSIPYDVIETNAGQVSGIVEQPSYQRYINAGAFLLSPKILESGPQAQSFEIKDLITRFVQAGRRVVSFPIHEYWREIQGYADYQQAIVDVKNGLFADLAIAVAGMEPGAPPPPGFVPLSVPELHGNEWAYVKECLDTNWVSSVGSFVDRFEQMLANFSNNKFAVAASSGTAALHTALLVAGILPNDEVIISTLTFIAPANAIRYAGAWPVFIDAEPDYWQMDPKKIAEFLENGCTQENGRLINKTTRRQVCAVMPVHILGHPCKMDEIVKLARRYNLIIIEDATESLGAKYLDTPVGHIGDIACFSFNGNKLITTGGGGMIVTDNEAWAIKAKFLTTQAKDDPLEFIHGELGYNYRLTNLLAAMGCAQMEQVLEYVASKQRIAKTYEQSLTDVFGLTLMKEAPWATSVFWMYTILVDESKYGMDSRALLRKLGEAGIQSRPLWQPLHLSPVFANLTKIEAPVAEWLNRQAISLPCSVGLTPQEQDRVISAILSNSR